MNDFHNIKRNDQKRIQCSITDCDKCAKVCEHVTWDTGNTKGISFFYYCMAHGIGQGYKKEMDNTAATKEKQ